jgi:ribosomal protein S15P/S13E
MTSLIGCLILILLGILIIIFVAQVLVVITEPDNKDIVSVVESRVDGFRESKAFPDGNLVKEPTYIDVHQNMVIIHPGQTEIPQRELFLPKNRLTDILDEIRKDAENQYVILLVRPRAAKLQRYLRDQVISQYNLDIGIELFESARPVEHVSSTRKLLQEQKEAAAEKGAAPAGDGEKGAAPPAGGDTEVKPGDANAGGTP